MGETRRIPWPGRRLCWSMISGGVVAGCWGLDRVAADLVAQWTRNRARSVALSATPSNSGVPRSAALGRGHPLVADSAGAAGPLQVSVSGLAVVSIQSPACVTGSLCSGCTWRGGGTPVSQCHRGVLDCRSRQSRIATASRSPVQPWTGGKIELAPSGQKLRVDGRFSQNLDARSFSGVTTALERSDRRPQLEGRGHWDRSGSICTAGWTGWRWTV